VDINSTLEFLKKDLFKKEPPLGVDISNESVVIVELKGLKGEGLEIVKLGMAATPSNTVRDGEIQNPEKIASVIQEIMDVHGFKTKSAITAVSGQSAIIRSPIKFPAASMKELKEVVIHDAERYIPFSINDVNLDFQVLNQVEEGGINKSEVVLVAAQKQLIQTYIDTFTLAGLNLLCVDVASFSVSRSLTGQRELGEGKLVVLILIRSETTDINVMKDGIPRFFRSIPVGSTTFIETLASEMNIELEDAIQLYDRMEVPLSGAQLPSKDKMVEQAKETIKPILKDITREIQTSLEYFHQSQETERIQQVILAGRGARMKNLDQHFNTTLDVDVVIGNPIDFLHFDEAQYPPEFLYENAPFLATAIGLARRGVEEF